MSIDSSRTKRRGQMNWLTSGAIGQLDTARRLIAQHSVFTWLLPWNDKTYLYLRNVVKDKETFLRWWGWNDP
jgi:hypothetical protein